MKALGRFALVGGIVGGRHCVTNTRTNGRTDA